MITLDVKDKKFLLSDEDVDLLKSRWFLKKNYAIRWFSVAGLRKKVLMHRVILSRIVGRELTREEECDHIDRNPLNNQRFNLRIATRRQNTFNTSKRPNTLHQYKGIFYCSREGRRKRWFAQIHEHGKHISLGCYMTEIEAALAYNEAARELHGEFASLNNIIGLKGASGSMSHGDFVRRAGRR